MLLCIQSGNMTQKRGIVLAALELRTDKLAELRAVAELQSDAELARRMGISQSSLHRVVTGASRPGVRFIAGLLAVFGGERWFERLFVIVPDDTRGA